MVNIRIFKCIYMKMTIIFILLVFFTIALYSQVDANTIDVLNNISNGSDKVIIASPIENGYRADVRVYERREEVWGLLYRTEGFFGRAGISDDKMEGDGATPMGVYTFGRAFGVEDDPGSILHYTKVTEDDVWVDDVNSKFYNQWSFMSNPDADWESVEHLINYPIAYKYSLTINYNTDPIVVGRGSAIFLHCSTDRPTAGCISVPEEAMIFLLGFIDEKTKIAIME